MLNICSRSWILLATHISQILKLIVFNFTRIILLFFYKLDVLELLILFCLMINRYKFLRFWNKKN